MVSYDFFLVDEVVYGFQMGVEQFVSFQFKIDFYSNGFCREVEQEVGKCGVVNQVEGQVVVFVFVFQLGQIEVKGVFLVLGFKFGFVLMDKIYCLV